MFLDTLKILIATFLVLVLFRVIFRMLDIKYPKAIDYFLFVAAAIGVYIVIHVNMLLL